MVMRVAWIRWPAVGFGTSRGEFLGKECSGADGVRSFFRLVAWGLLAAALWAAAGGLAAAAGADGGPAVVLTAEEAEALALVNADRRAAGLPALKVNTALVALARDYADDMSTRGFVGHYNPEGESPFDRMGRYGVTYAFAGENLAAHRSVAEAQRLLMASESHRANILSADYREVGIGVRPGPHGLLYVVQEFVGR